MKHSGQHERHNPLKELKKINGPVSEIHLQEATFWDTVVYPSAINFFYGKNGVGKTTIANTIVYWADPSLDKTRDFSVDNLHSYDDHSYIEWYKEDPNGYEIQIYNQEFVNDEFQESESIPGIYTAFKENIQINEQIELLQQKREELNRSKDNTVQTYDQTSETRRSVVYQFSSTLWETTQLERTIFPLCLEKYDDSDKLVKAVLDASADLSADFSRSRIEEYYNFAFSTGDKNYQLLTIPKNITAYRDLDGYKLLEKKIINSSDNSYFQMIQSLKATGWVRTGFHQYLHSSENKNEVCPFCQQELPDSFEKELGDYYTGEYEKELSTIEELYKNYRSELTRILDCIAEALSKNYKGIDFEHLREQYIDLKNLVNSNYELLQKKMDDPSLVIHLFSIDDQIEDIAKTLNSLNSTIIRRNTIILGRNISKEECNNLVLSYIAKVHQNEIANYQEQLVELDSTLKQQNTIAKLIIPQLDEIENCITKLESQIQNVTGVMDSINIFLKNSGYYGFHLEAAESKGDYAVVRNNGDLADNLSEGERNFIAFLYFYYNVSGQLTPGFRKQRAKIVIIDDPVSSLDNDAMDLVASLVRNFIENCHSYYSVESKKKQKSKIAQLFVFTHNSYFHNAVTKGQNSNDLYNLVNFYEIRKNEDNRSDCKLCYRRRTDIAGIAYSNLNPVQDEYLMLWSQLHDTEQPQIVINSIRQILERYFLQMCGYDGNTLQKIILEDHHDAFITNLANFEDDTDYQIAKSMLSCMTSNPSLMDSGINHSTDWQSNAKKYLEVFKLIFKCMGQSEHYNMMWKHSVK